MVNLLVWVMHQAPAERTFDRSSTKVRKEQNNRKQTKMQKSEGPSPLLAWAVVRWRQEGNFRENESKCGPEGVVLAGWRPRPSGEEKEAIEAKDERVRPTVAWRTLVSEPGRSF